MSGELTKEQLLEYVRKQKMKIKKLETDLAAAKETQSLPDSTSKESSEDMLSDLTARIQDLETQCQRKDNDLVAKTKKVIELETALREQAAQQQHLQAEINALQEQLSFLHVTKQGENSFLLTENARLKRESEVQEEEAAKQQDQSKHQAETIRALRTSQDQFMLEIKQWECKYGELLSQFEQEKEDSAKSQAALKSSVEELREKELQYEAVIHRLQVQLIESDAAAQSKEKSSAFLSQQQVESIHRLNAEIVSLQQQIHDLTLKCSFSNESLQQQNYKNEQLDQNIRSLLLERAKGASEELPAPKSSVPPEGEAQEEHRSVPAAVQDQANGSEAVLLLQKRLEDERERYRRLEENVERERQEFELRFSKLHEEHKSLSLQILELLESKAVNEKELRQMEENGLKQEEEQRRLIEELRRDKESLTLQTDILKQDLQQRVDQDQIEKERQNWTQLLESTQEKFESELRQLTEKLFEEEKLRHSMELSTQTLRKHLIMAEQDSLDKQSAERQLQDQFQAINSQLNDARQLIDQLELLQKQAVEEKREMTQANEDLHQQLLNRSEQLERLQVQLQSSAQSSDHCSAQATEEIERLKTEVSNKEDLNKKLTIKLKQKMKDVNDLQEKCDSLQKSHDNLQEKVSQSHAKLTDMNQLLLDGETKISSLLADKNALREQIQQLEAAIHAAKNEFAQKQQEFLAFQQKSNEHLNQLQQTSLEKHELQLKFQDLQHQHRSLSQERERSAQQLVQHQQVIQQLNERIKQSEVSSQEFSQSKEQLERDKSDYLFKEKKYKAMIVKMNNSLQEKENKINQYELLFVRRPKRFQVLLKMNIDSSLVSLLSSTVATNSSSLHHGSLHSITTDAYSEWCYIFIDSPPSVDFPAAATDGNDPATLVTVAAAGAAHTTSSSTAATAATGTEYRKYRWIEASLIQEWIQQGSSVIGNQPSQSVDQLFTRAYSDLKEHFTQEKNELANNYQEILQQFQTYKTRAQAALKRMNQEDRERQQKQEQENEQILKLQEIIEESRKQNAAITERMKEYSESCEENENRLKEKTQSLHTLQLLYEEMRGELDLARTQSLKDAEELQRQQRLLDGLNHDHQQLLAKYQQKLKEIEEASAISDQHISSTANRASSLRTVDSGTSHLFDQIPVPLAIPVVEKESLSAETHRIPSVSSNVSLPAADVPTTSSASSQPRKLPTSPNSSSSSSNSFTAVASGTHSSNNSKLLVFQQADSLLKENLQILRDENSNLMLEVMELRNDVTLRNEQIDALKATVRELESSLLREQEFNSSNRRLNADYLVNVLRKFLMTTDPSERSKLVSVLCTMLHLQPEESRVISEKWAVKSAGFVSWLLPANPSSAPTHNIGKGKSASNEPNAAGGDLTYDPLTGGGIDFSSY